MTQRNNKKEITLKSSDGVIFRLNEEDARRSKTIESMLLLTSEDDEDDEVILETIDSNDLQLVVNWLHGVELPNKIELLLNLAITANFLDIPDLLNELCKKVAEMVQGKSNAQIKHFFTKIDLAVSADKTCKESLHPYDGKNEQLITQNQCFSSSCKVEVPDVLYVCGRCKLVKYCSKECQTNDISYHVDFCKEIKKLLKKMERLAIPLRNHQDWIGGPRENLFETGVGHFWGLLDPRDYCRARLELADTILQFANQYEHSYLYRAGLSHYMELLRLIHGDNMGLRDRTPFILLSLNRDDDAYNFIKWWETIDPDGTYDWGEAPPSNEGDWLYLTDQSRFEDPSPFFGNYSSLPFLVAVAIMKLRIIAKHESRVRQFDCFQECLQESSQWSIALAHILPSIKKELVGDKSHDVLMQQQTQHLDALLKQINKSNKIFLPSVVNPGPLKQNPYPGSYSMGSAEEAWLLLNSVTGMSPGMFQRIPGAMDRITAVVGKNPQYDAKFAERNWGF